MRTSTEAKYELYEQIYWWLRSLDSEDELRDAVRDLGARYGVDSAAFCNESVHDLGARSARSPPIRSSPSARTPSIT